MVIDTWFEPTLLGLLGLLVGSFLNVVIYRLPVIMQRAWKRDSIAFLREQGLQLEEVSQEEVPRFNLMVPRSRCRQCGHAISAIENIPVLSYLVLRGKCRGCGTPIGMRYPLVEIVTGLAFAYCGHRWGLSYTGAAWAGFCAVIIALVMIDWDTTLLPDDMTLPLLWAGILAAWLGVINVPLAQSVLGAIVGYLSLWSVCLLFKLVTGKDGMGNGDFKLLAALGAWLGVWAILPIVLVSSVLGAVIGIALKLTNRLREGGYMPFGPFLGGAGLFVLMVGTDTINRWLNTLLGMH
ncbi:prepilin peptidase [Lampropedia puyangensis]|uniref:Prepilin leader peptidase/N-methyltransferase n=1 Tax=Lampropedia puyangensis TaxID=1330072 RepID=A0A4V4GR67_9BURK|nr:A24 family peptidase [Lampropedia puyangensis]THU00296.1 prepilin peptidase [Lampropedia puyangensis]